MGFLTDTVRIPEVVRETHPYFTVLHKKYGTGWCVGTTICSPNGDSLVISSERALAAGPVPEEAAQTLDLYRPHLARSALIAARFGLERISATVMALELLGLPAAVLSNVNKILAANRLFTACGGSLDLGRGDVIRLISEMPSAGQLLGGGASLPINMDGGRLGILHAIPMRGDARDIFAGAKYLLYVTTMGSVTSPDESVLLALFDLTPAEARIVKMLFACMSTKEMAASANVQENTIRAHLKSVYAKIGVGDRAALIQRLGVSDVGARLNR